MVHLVHVAPRIRPLAIAALVALVMLLGAMSADAGGADRKSPGNITWEATARNITWE